MQDIEHKMNEEKLCRIIAAAYKDAGLVDRIKVYFLTKKNPEIKKIFDEYRATAKSIENISLDKCPDSVVESIRIQTDKDKRLFTFKPANVFAVSMVVAALAATIIIYQNKEEEPVYTRAEIEIAEEQVKSSLAIVNRIFKKTENLIQDEVLPKRVGKPIHKSLTIINDVLIGG